MWWQKLVCRKNFCVDLVKLWLIMVHWCPWRDRKREKKNWKRNSFCHFQLILSFVVFCFWSALALLLLFTTKGPTRERERERESGLCFIKQLMVGGPTLVSELKYQTSLITHLLICQTKITNWKDPHYSFKPN